MSLDATNGCIPLGKLPRVYDVDDAVAWFQVDGRYYGFPTESVKIETGKVYQLADEAAIRAAILERLHIRELPHHPVEERLGDGA